VLRVITKRLAPVRAFSSQYLRVREIGQSCRFVNGKPIPLMRRNRSGSSGPRSDVPSL